MTRTPTIFLLALFVFLMLATLLPRDANSQNFQPGRLEIACAPGADTVEKWVKESFDETVVWVGKSSGLVFMLHRSPDGDSWTFSSNSGTVSCLLSVGNENTVVDAPPATPENF